jgi:hypothetical protein
MNPNVDLIVAQDDPRRHRVVETPAPDSAALADGEVLVRVEKFGLSANNVTYAVLGKSDIINYFDFFPTDEPGWGRVPVWGMAEIVASRHAEVARGERMYGYFPLARYTRLRAARVTATGFEVDRGNLPAAYNQYTLTRSDPFYVRGKEDAMLVFRPLMLTAILLDDFVADGNDWFGADAVLIASASSKTSFGLAYMLARRQPTRMTVGLTSKRNADFVRRLGLYSRVVTYDEVGGLPADVPSVFVDVAGDARVRDAVRARLGSQLKATITVGLSHWDQAGRLPGVGTSGGGEPTIFFFAPGWLEQRRAEWGPAKLGERVVGAWHAFMADVDRFVRVVHGAGTQAVSSLYDRMVAGACGPDEAHVLSLFDDAFTSR